MPSKIIKLATKHKYTHVSISKDCTLSSMYSFGRKYLHFPLPGGFIKEDINNGLYSNGKTLISVYRIPVSEKDINDFDNYINNFQKVDTFYDVKGAVGIYFNKNMFSENGYVCSSFVSKILESLNILTYEDCWKIKPQDLIQIDDLDLELIYEGEASKYKIKCERSETDEIQESNLWSL